MALASHHSACGGGAGSRKACQAGCWKGAVREASPLLAAALALHWRGGAPACLPLPGPPTHLPLRIALELLPAVHDARPGAQLPPGRRLLRLRLPVLQLDGHRDQRLLLALGGPAEGRG